MNRNTPEDLVRELLQSNRNLAQDDWITIHPNGEEGGYRRIEIDKDGTILKDGEDPYKAWKEEQENAPKDVVY